MSASQEELEIGPGVKTLAVRLKQEMHTQLSLIAQLRGNNIANEIRQAIAAHIKALKADPIVVGRADGALKDIEAEAAERRKAIATLFDDSSSAGASATAARPRTRKGAESAADNA